MGRLYDGPTRGIWTPALTFATPGDLVVAYATQWGESHLESGWVRLNFVIIANTFTHTTASGALRISGSPFTARTSTGAIWSGGFHQFQGITKATFTHFSPGISSAGTLIIPQANGSGQTSGTVNATDMPTGTTKVLNGFVTFPVA